MTNRRPIACRSLSSPSSFAFPNVILERNEVVASMPAKHLSLFACFFVAIAGCGKTDRPAIEFPEHPAPMRTIQLKSLDSRRVESSAAKAASNPPTRRDPVK
jgi:hypothetical protein